MNESEHYRVLPGVEDLLPRLLDEGYLLGLIIGNLEAAAHIKLHRVGLNRLSSSPSAATARTPTTAPR
ncbi:hypothetical protein ACFY2M_37415 [Streptomyces sp. NPDC001276]|uniref:hypothetical protein n=1 Tax=Streptomyces sp. NPDC001276 TaxID=3364555 RepID=UPI0036C7458B